MPKPTQNKRKAEDSDSDSSGPDDRGPVKKTPGKAPATKGGSKAPTKAPVMTIKEGSTAERDDDGNLRWHLESRKFATVRSFEGKTYIDIREFYDAGGELKPGKKGLSLSIQQWNLLKDKVEDIDQALREAV